MNKSRNESPTRLTLERTPSVAQSNQVSTKVERRDLERDSLESRGVSTSRSIDVLRSRGTRRPEVASPEPPRTVSHRYRTIEVVGRRLGRKRSKTSQGTDGVEELENERCATHRGNPLS